MQDANMMKNVGIRREDKSVWQRRAPLTPGHIRQLLTLRPQIKFYIQPSEKRIFSDYEYQKAGAIICEDLQHCPTIIGIKEVPIEKLLQNKTYIYFSHTIKAQPQNMAALDTILSRKIRLIDYEVITDQQKNRLIAFGYYAGVAGALDFLKGFGQYIMEMGISTPLLHVNCAYKYENTQEAFKHLQIIGKRIENNELPRRLLPMIFAITGRGRTANGVLQVLKKLPIKIVSVNDLPGLCSNPNNPQHRMYIYVCNVNTEDIMVHSDSNKLYSKQDFKQNPQNYVCKFQQRVLPYITALFHCIFWTADYPRYISNQGLKKLGDQNRLRLLGISDITCDLSGSIQCLTQFTTPNAPFFYWHCTNKAISNNSLYENNKIIYLAEDFLPCQLAFDASVRFSSKLKQWIPQIIASDSTKPIHQQGLSPELERAVITSNGSLTPNFQYIAKLRQQNAKL